MECQSELTHQLFPRIFHPHLVRKQWCDWPSRSFFPSGLSLPKGTSLVMAKKASSVEKLWCFKLSVPLIMKNFLQLALEGKSPQRVLILTPVKCLGCYKQWVWLRFISWEWNQLQLIRLGDTALHLSDRQIFHEFQVCTFIFSLGSILQSIEKNCLKSLHQQTEL